MSYEDSSSRDTSYQRHQSSPGEAPGTLTPVGPATTPTITVIAYDESQFVEEVVEDPADIDDHLDRFAVVWVNVEGLGHPELLLKIGERFGLHVLALEDVTHFHQRAKLEEYGEHIFIVARMVEQDIVRRISTDDTVERLVAEPNTPINTEQLGIFVKQGVVLTFQDGKPGDCLNPLRNRIRNSTGRIRRRGADALAYAILDTTIDYYFPIVDELGVALDRTDSAIFSNDSHENDAAISLIHQVRGRLLQLRRILRPHAEMLSQLLRCESELIQDDTRLFIRDCHDHAIQLLDAVESCRETCSDLRDAHFTIVSSRQNEAMKTLTIIATVFIPMSFVAGLYGMNFELMPELKWRFGYPLALGLMVSVAIALQVWIRRRGWM